MADQEEASKLTRAGVGTSVGGSTLPGGGLKYSVKG